MRAFPGLNNIPENADAFGSQEYSDTGDYCAFSIQIDTTLMTDKVNPNFQVMGSNISGNAVDMLPVKDEYGVVGPISMATMFEKKYFPYKWIGIQYTANTNAGAGTFTASMEKKAQRINIA